MQFGLQLNSQHPATENMRDRLYELPEQVRLALERQMALYREALAQRGKPFPQEIPIRRELFVAKDRDTALRTCMPYLERTYQTYVSWGQSGALPQEDTLDLHSTSDGISASSSAAQMIVSSSNTSITSASEPTIFCYGFNGLECPKSRYWKLEAITLVGERIHSAPASCLAS